MRWPSYTRCTPIGVDIGRRCVKAIQLAPTRAGQRIGAAAVLPRQEDGALLGATDAQRLREVLYRQGFRGAEVVLAAPSSALHADVMELPPRSSDAPLEQIARAELGRTGKLETETFEVAFWDLPAPARGKGATHAMGVALRHSDAEAVVDVFEEQGLTVAALDCQAWAMARACESQAGQGVTGMLDMGWGSALLVLMHQGMVIYQRIVAETGLGAMRARVIEELGVDEEAAEYLLRQVGLGDKVADADPTHVRTINTILGRYLDAMAAELEVPFSYAAHRYPDTPVEKLLVVGGTAALPGACERIGAALSFPVKPVRPDELALCNPELNERCGTPLLTTALGLARHPGD